MSSRGAGTQCQQHGLFASFRFQKRLQAYTACPARLAVGPKTCGLRAHLCTGQDPYLNVREGLKLSNLRDSGKSACEGAAEEDASAWGLFTWLSVVMSSTMSSKTFADSRSKILEAQ